MKGNISTEMATALRNERTKAEVLNIVRSGNAGTVTIAGKRYKIYRAGTTDKK